MDVPLRQPYRLSYGTLESFDTCLAYLTLEDGTESVGEVVVLPGYHQESTEAVIHKLRIWGAEISGHELPDARTDISKRLTKSPCAASVLLSAIDMYDPGKRNERSSEISVPLVFPVSSQESNLVSIIHQAADDGYTTVKIKVGKYLVEDLQAVKELHQSLPHETAIRFDANQAYSFDEAQRFCSAVEKYLFDATELVEQPLPVDSWKEMSALAERTSVPLMLDESIYTREDVNMAAQCGCRLIKLKLCKHGGAKELVQLAEHAGRGGLKVILGNGVATDISNIVELQVYDQNRHLFFGACESNGFVKLRDSIGDGRLTLKSGSACWRERAVEKLTRTWKNQ
jgi:o-succinylbenzoate synthase